jgi:hypothetical protein
LRAVEASGGGRNVAHKKEIVEKRIAPQRAAERGARARSKLYARVAEQAQLRARGGAQERTMRWYIADYGQRTRRSTADSARQRSASRRGPGACRGNGNASSTHAGHATTGVLK